MVVRGCRCAVRCGAVAARRGGGAGSGAYALVAVRVELVVLPACAVDAEAVEQSCRSSASSRSRGRGGRRAGHGDDAAVIAARRLRRSGDASSMMRSARWRASSTSWVTSRTVVGRGGVDVEQQVLHLEPGERIEGAERLVEQQHAGVAGEGAGEGGALGHAAGDLAGAVVGRAGRGRRGRAARRGGRGAALAYSVGPCGRPRATLSRRVRQGRRRGSWKPTAQRGSAGGRACRR